MRLAMAVAANRVDGAVELAERLLCRVQQLAAGGGQLERARAAHEEGATDLAFECCHLPADRRLRQVQLAGGERERQQPRGSLEATQRGQPDRAAPVQWVRPFMRRLYMH